MDPDYIDPKVLQARAQAKGNRGEDLKVAPRPRVRRVPETAPRGGVQLKGALAGVVVTAGKVRGRPGLSVSKAQRVSIS